MKSSFPSIQGGHTDTHLVPSLAFQKMQMTDLSSAQQQHFLSPSLPSFLLQVLPSPPLSHAPSVKLAYQKIGVVEAVYWRRGAVSVERRRDSLSDLTVCSGGGQQTFSAWGHWSLISDTNTHC